jgi:hypothetical protein
MFDSIHLEDLHLKYWLLFAALSLCVVMGSLLLQRILRRLLGRSNARSRSLSSPMVSLVALLRRPAPLEVDSVRQVLDDLFPGRFLPRNDDCFVVEGPAPNQVAIKSLVPAHTGFFLAISAPVPYTNASPFAASLADPELIEIATNHEAWLSIDLIGPVGGVDDAYRLIGKALARLAVHPLGIVHPHTCTTLRFSDTVLNGLRSDAVLASIGVGRG